MKYHTDIIIKAIAAAFITIGSTGALSAADNAAAYTRAMLHPRAVGLGGSYVSLATGSDALYWNPAGLAIQDSLAELHVMGTHQFETDYLRLDTAFTVRDIPIGLGILHSGLDGIAETQRSSSTGRNEETGEVLDYTGQGLYVGSSKQVRDNLLLGATLSYLKESTAGESAHGFGLDLGLLMLPTERIKVGATIKNAIKPSMRWSTDSGHRDTVPRYYIMGSSMSFFGGRLIATMSTVLRNNREAKLQYGIEFFPINRVGCRIGMDDGLLTVGTGVDIGDIEANISWKQKDFDVIDEAYQFGMTYRFGGVK